MTYDYELTLIGEASYTEDEIGNQIAIESETIVLCGIKSIARNEFYNAAQAGLKPEITFIIHPYEYAGENKVEFEGSKYKVLRTYNVDFENLELTCEKVGA